MNFKEEYKAAMNEIAPDEQAVSRIENAVIEKISSGEALNNAENKKKKSPIFIYIGTFAGAACAGLAIFAGIALIGTRVVTGGGAAQNFAAADSEQTRPSAPQYIANAASDGAAEDSFSPKPETAASAEDIFSNGENIKDLDKSDNAAVSDDDAGNFPAGDDFAEASFVSPSDFDQNAGTVETEPSASSTIFIDKYGAEQIIIGDDVYVFFEASGDVYPFCANLVFLTDGGDAFEGFLDGDVLEIFNSSLSEKLVYLKVGD